MGGADVGWGYDPNANPSYPDNNYELTDGYIPTAGAPGEADAYNADCWMALHQNTPEQTERGSGRELHHQRDQHHLSQAL